MKTMLVRAGMACALAMAVPVSSAAASPADGGYCESMAQSGSCSVTWTADVSGEYGGLTSGSWEIDVQVTTNGVTSWQRFSGGGPGQFSAAPGALGLGNTYLLVINGEGGGALGSVTGTSII
jgi:hypothetical protein